MSNGFLTTAPSVRHGTLSSSSPGSGAVFAQKFTAGGAGKQQIIEIGIWVSADASTSGIFHLGIFTDDAGNGCPEAIVTNSDSGELTIATTTFTKVSFSYVNMPIITGGAAYWLCSIFGDANGNQDYIATGGTSLYKTGLSYPTWPTGTQWHTHTDVAYDTSIYAVYRGIQDGRVGVLSGAGANSRLLALGRLKGGTI